MPALYVQNVPDDLYKALKQRARERHTSMAAEIIEILSAMVPTEEAMERRWAAHRRLSELQKQPSPGPGPFPTAEEMIREDRQR